jgi:hypothetical protein
MALIDQWDRGNEAPRHGAQLLDDDDLVCSVHRDLAAVAGDERTTARHDTAVSSVKVCCALPGGVSADLPLRGA